MDTTGISQQSLPSSSSRQEVTFVSSPLPSWQRTRASGLVRCGAAALALFALSACGNIEPWVKPYERQALADPIMSFDPNPVSSAYIDHVYEAREGARGALGSSGGGCGCN
ncbi:MAG TPA: DUF4266 domain-containing protein [Povalibacter sp.]|nr:DUF4266 domain-containing protein [Povalibacter sp.]